MTLKVSSINVVPGNTITIYVQDFNFLNNKNYKLDFTLTEPMLSKFGRITGVEQVRLNNLVVGNVMCYDATGNILYSDRLRNRFCYSIRFGNNGLLPNANHFVFTHLPCCPHPYNPGGFGASAPILPVPITQTDEGA